jgi:hypothetical protein
LQSAQPTLCLAALVVLKELFDNALDAAEEAEIARTCWRRAPSPHPAERDRSSVLAVVRAHALDLAGRDPHDVDGIADHVSGAALASGTLSHRTTSSRNLLK